MNCTRLEPHHCLINAVDTIKRKRKRSKKQTEQKKYNKGTNRIVANWRNDSKIVLT